jgi:NTP-dependent ternary system trypsin peptidase co-occuring protein
MGVVDMSGLELASVIRQLRAELNEAMDDAEGERLRFELGPVELSLTVTVGRAATPGAKVRFWVIEAGVDVNVSREAVQDIKLVLSPRDMKAPLGPDGKPVPPLIGGKQVKDED